MDEQVLSVEARYMPATRVVVLNRTKERGGSLLRAFGLAGAVVEEVAEFPALLAEMNRDPCPDLVVLGWQNEGGTIEARLGGVAPESGPAAEGLDLRLDSSRALWRGRRIGLSLTEFRVVCRLARQRGQDVSHRELYDIIKGDGFVSGQGKDGYRCNVRAAIKRIRQKFRLVDPEFGAIRSYHGFGYRWEEKAADAASPSPPFRRPD